MSPKTQKKLVCKTHNKKSDHRREVKYYGLSVCKALFKRRRDDIIRVYAIKSQITQFKELLQWCASTKRAYHVVSKDELEKISESVHHQGICILTKEASYFDDQIFLQALPLKHNNKCTPIIYLAGTSNPHNVGAILRSAAHFGVSFVIGDVQDLPHISGSLARISEGGCECVRMVRLANPTQVLQTLKDQGYAIIATSQFSGKSLFDYKWSEKSVVILGNEVTGIDPVIAKIANFNINIPGTGQVESLNVSVACGVILGEWYRNVKNQQ